VWLDLVGYEQHLLERRHARASGCVAVDAIDNPRVVDTGVLNQHACRYRAVHEDRLSALDGVGLEAVAFRQRQQFLALLVTHEVVPQRRQRRALEINPVQVRKTKGLGFDAQDVLSQASGEGLERRA